jgi:hypothetical protein
MKQYNRFFFFMSAGFLSGRKMRWKIVGTPLLPVNSVVSVVIISCQEWASTLENILAV